jgi:hypothetical protein
MQGGEAREVLESSRQLPSYGGNFTRRGNVELTCPTETIDVPEGMQHPFRALKIRNPRKGACSNIWQVGVVMNSLLLGKPLNFNKKITHFPKLPTSIQRSVMGSTTASASTLLQ